MLGPDGRIGHVEVELGDAVINLVRRAARVAPDTWRICGSTSPTPQETFDRAVAAGARAVTHPTELAFGERVARVRDPRATSGGYTKGSRRM